MKTFLYTCLLLSSAPAFSQYASFSADSVLMDRYAPHDSTLRAHILQWEWQINGKKLTWGSAPVYVKPEPGKLTKVLFRKKPGYKWDTLLCNVSHPYAYTFIFNECCGAFNVQVHKSKKEKFEGSTVIMKVVNGANRKFLGINEESGRWIRPGLDDTVFSYCHSAMAPNLFNISLQLVNECDTLPQCTDSIGCMMDAQLGGWENAYLYRYTKLKTLVQFTWMPGGDPIHIRYDAATDKVRIY